MKKTKFVLLGGQNAGKTSILRRYFQGTFYGDCRLPTVGADVYSTIASTRTPDESFPESASTSTSASMSFDRGGRDEEKKGETHDAAANGTANGTANGNGNRNGLGIGSNENTHTNHHYHHHHHHHHDRARTPTQRDRRPISIQVWDTPGRERFVNTDGKTRFTASFSDNFLKDIDAVCLVYDVSSSTSFTHVLNWYYELMERLRRMKANHERRRHLPIVIVGNKIDIIQDRDNARQFRRQREEVLRNRRKEIVVQRRNVLGLKGKNWRGRDYRYEYASSSSKSPPRHSRNNSNSNSNSDNGNGNGNGKTNNSNKNNNKNKKNNTDNKNEEGRENRLELLTYLGTNTNYLEAILNNEVYRGSYLDSLLSSEDNSHPDKDMVQLWCTRNGLIHMDVSAKSGAGIDNLIDQLVEIALKQMDDEDDDDETTARAATTEITDGENKNENKNRSVHSATLLLQSNQELDLHKRYGPKSSSCLPFPMSFQCCCR